MPVIKENYEDIFIDSYEKLNPEQRHAVDTTEGPVMVLAGPGTGKTQILAMRIASILRSPDLQMNPSNILCLTFTESGVAAMRSRLISIIGPAAYSVKIHTFHSFCSEIIKDYPDKFLNINFVSDIEQIEILNLLIDKLPSTSPIKPYGAPYFYRNDLISSIKTLKRESVSVEQLIETISATEKLINEHRDIIEAFISRNARSIKEEDCLSFLDDCSEIHYFRNFWQQSEKIAEFKKKVKDFFEKNLKEIPKQKDLALIYQGYISELQSRSLFDFEDMILKVIRALETNQELLLRYQEQFQYILVDEYQDTNGSQNRILELLTSFHSENPNIFVVGDDDQSIFRFQGASVENIIHFYKRFQENAEVIVLDKNYRSQQIVLDAAIASINYNQSRISNIIEQVVKNLNAQQDFKPELIEVNQYEDLSDEIFNIGTKIKELLAQGVPGDEITILYRGNKDAEPIIDSFSRMDIPFSVETGENILDDILIAQLIDLFKVIYSPDKNSDLLFNLLNYDFILNSHGFSAEDVFQITRKRKELSRLALAADENAVPVSFIEVLLKDEKFSIFAQKLLGAQQKSLNYKFDNFFEYVINEFNFLSFMLQHEHKIECLNRLNTLFHEVKFLASSKSPLDRVSFFNQKTRDLFDLEDFINYISLLKENNVAIKASPIKTSNHAVKLMTAHKSKGLEFEHVFIHKFLDKQWSNKRDLSKLKLPPSLIEETGSMASSDDKDEDDRRLFFVALTRAKKKAYICYHALNDKGQEQVPALFLAEIPDELKRKSSYKDLDTVNSSSQLRKLETSFTKPKLSLADLEKAYIDELLKDYKVSVTHLNHYFFCPRFFFYQDLLKVPSAANKFSSFGTAIHAALYDFYLNFKVKSPSDLELNYLLKRFEMHLKDQGLNDIDYKDSLEFGIETLTNYYAKYAQISVRDTLLEYDFSYKGIDIDGISITGKVDKIEILSTESNTVNVVDYKTGNPSNKAKELKPGGEYFRQIAFYKLLIDKARQSGESKYKMEYGEIDFVQSSSDGKYTKKQIKISSEDIDDLIAEIKDTHSKIKAQEFPMTSDKSSCEKCRFNHICLA